MQGAEYRVQCTSRSTGIAGLLTRVIQDTRASDL